MTCDHPGCDQPAHQALTWWGTEHWCDQHDDQKGTA